MALTPSFMMKVEQNMRVLSENAYNAALSNVWWPKVMKEMSSKSQKEHLFWLLQTGNFDYGVEGNVEFVDQAVQNMIVEPKFITAPGLRILKSQFDDQEGAGLQLAAQWAQQRGVQAALFPQIKLAEQLVSNPTCYDGKTFFHASEHLVNPKDPSAGLFANDFTSSATDGTPGSAAPNPGALPIHGVSPDVAHRNLAKAFAYIRSIPSPDGKTPRHLKPLCLLVPPALEAPALLASKTAFVGGTVGSTDVMASVNAFKLEDPIVAPELAKVNGGSDTTYYVVCRDEGTELGAWLYTNREAAHIVYHGPMTSAELARKRVFEWTMGGRASIDPGHPFMLFRVQAT